MKYLIHLFKVINSNVGDSTLVFIGEDLREYESNLQLLESFFNLNKTHLKTTQYVKGDGTRTEAYIEYSLLKENKDANSI